MATPPRARWTRSEPLKPAHGPTSPKGVIRASTSLGNSASSWSGAAPDQLLAEFPRLVLARMTPFGDVGPWAGFKGSDLVHLALGGVAMNCGYDPEPGGSYDLPPIAPQMWHAYHIAG